MRRLYDGVVRRRADLHATREQLLKTLAFPSTDHKPVLGRYSSRAARVAVVVVDVLLEEAERKRRYYVSLMREPVPSEGGDRCPLYHVLMRALHMEVPAPELGSSTTFVAGMRQALCHLKHVSAFALARLRGECPEDPQRHRTERAVDEILDLSQSFVELCDRDDDDGRVLKKAREQLVLQAGSRFEPHLVEAFLSSWRPLLAIARDATGARVTRHA